MKCYCGMDVPEGRLHYPGNNPEDGPAHRPATESPDCPKCGLPRNHPGPCQIDETDQCYFCGRWSQDPKADGWVEVTVDADPGDPEVGPQPDIIVVGKCGTCQESGHGH